MTITEIVYVLDKEKECIQRRADGCDKDCKQCGCHMDSGSMLDAFDRIMNLVFKIDNHGTRRKCCQCK